MKNFGVVMLLTSVVLVSCSQKNVNDSKEVTRNAALMKDLNKGDNQSIINNISENTEVDSEKIILASALAQEAGVDVYTLLPILKEKVFHGPIATQQKVKDKLGILKRIVENTEQKVKLKIANKDIDNALIALKQVEEEAINLDEDAFSKKDVVRIKAALTLINPSFDKVRADSKEDLVSFISKAVREIETKVNEQREGQAEEKFITLELDLGSLKKEIVKIISSIIEIVPVVSLTPEVKDEDMAKIDKAIKILESAGKSDEATVKRAKSYVIFLSSVMIVNKARRILELNEDLNEMICSLSEEKLLDFLIKSERYFTSLNKAATDLNSIEETSTFKKLSDGSAKILQMEEDFRNKSVKALMIVVEKEKKKLCE